MMSNILTLAVFVLASSVVLEAQFPKPKIIVPKPGSVQPWIPSLDDIRLCRENANGRKMKLVVKIPLQTCRPMCIYENEKEQVNSVDGQLCCDLVGVAPTGICKNGTCLVGGVVGMDKNGVKTMFD
ncbi:uncharacterized protein TNCT_573471 [Trichonephila clavata]|uniref:Uncharacterized protein n=1 Tax=Trichonephila clavata TaxID=2740835 RepID=A0A8X6HCB9_TRICU|nr:uncharacterized protein TNCT_573471 [Trichonephila clavata]